MAGYTDASGDCLFWALEYELQVWADGDPDGPPGGVPYAYDGDDGVGHGESREQYECHLAPPVRHLVLQLEADGRTMAADMLRKAFDALAAQASQMDEWCEGRPIPDDCDNWPPAVVFAAIGDPGMRILKTCYRTIQEIREIVAPDGGVKPTTAPLDSKPKKQKPKGRTVDAIRALQAGKGTEYLVLELGYSAEGARKVKSRLGNNEYEL